MRIMLRAMRRSPIVMVTAAITIALGCASTGVVFATVNGWLSVAWAIPHSDRLVFIARTQNGIEVPQGYFREQEYKRLFDRKLQTVRHLFATEPVPAVLSLNNTAHSVRLEVVAGAYFPAVGVPPLLGRALTVDDEMAGPSVPIVLGEGAWRRLFAEDSRVIGRTVRISGLPSTVVGVMPAAVRGFSTPTATTVDVWAPVASVRSVVDPKGRGVWGQVFGRLEDGVSLREAEAEIRVATIQLDDERRELGATALPVEHGVMSNRARVGLRVAGAAAVALSSLVLFIACANLATLLLAQGVQRSTEMAVRVALGATPSRLIRLQFFETAPLAVSGAAVGFLLVRWASRALGPFTVSPDGNTGITGALVVDASLLAYFCLLAVAAATAISLPPTLRAVRVDPAKVLSLSGSHGRTAASKRSRTILVVSQMAASMVLLVVAILFVRSAVNASHYRVAFNTRHVAQGEFDFAALGWDEQRGRNQQEELLQIARSVPGVGSAALSTGLPADGGGELVDIETVEANLGSQEFGPPCRCLSVSPGLFAALGMNLLRGRDFTTADEAGSADVVIVNQIAASRLWRGGDPLGQQLRIRKGGRHEIVGVVAETDHTASDMADRCYVFVPMRQWYRSHFILIVTAASPASLMTQPLEAAVAAGAPDVSMFNVTTADQYLNRHGGSLRSVAMAVVVLGLVGFTIALAGLSGVMAHLVGLRRAEFGIRKMAGATDAEIYGLVSWEACRLLLIGVLAGVPIAYAASVSVRQALVGVKPHDPATYVIASVSLIVVGLIAAWWPARQAARLEPAVALRDL